MKFARLYGFEHSRTIEQLDIAWRELRTAIPPGTDSGLMLGATGSQLLLDGVPLEGAPAEKQFAQLLSAAGLASIQFFPSVTQEEIVSFARAFPTGKAKPIELAKQLKAALTGAQGIRLNEVCFVATDSRLKDASMAAQLAAASLGDDQDEFKKWLNDPQKLLELIAAAQGSRGSGPMGSGTGTRDSASGGRDAAAGIGSGGIGGGTTGAGGSGLPGPEGLGSGGVGTGIGGSLPVGPYVAGSTGTGVVGQVGGTPGATFGGGTGVAGGGGAGSGGPWRGTGQSSGPSEDEIYGILGALTSFGNVGAGQGGVAAAGVFQEQMSQLPGSAQDTLKRAIAGLAAQAPAGQPDESVLVKLAEHLAIKFALERFETGEVKVNAVRQMLDRMNQEIENLRKILGAHEDKMTDAGMMVESHREILDRQFWAAVPESGKQAVLMSGDAWCIPPKNVQSYVAHLIETGDVAQAIGILQNYASCAESEELDARKKTAMGLSEMAELYAKADPKLLGEALRHLGLRLSVEQDTDLQTLVSAAFVRLSQEAATSRCFPVMEQALDLISGVESQRPGIARSLRPKMGIEERVPEFVDEALRARQAAAGMTNVLKMLPQTAMEQLSMRFNRCSLREDAEHISNLAADLGEEGLQYLRSTVRGGPIAEAVEMAGLLSKLDPEAVEVFLPSRMKDFPQTSQDRIVRQISASGAPARSRILLELLDHVDPLIMPLVIDEIGVTSDREALGRLLTIVDGDLPSGAGPYLQVKAIEALGRIHAPESVTTLKRIVETKKMFGWGHAQELRIAALQALISLEPDWARDFVAKSGIDREDLALAPLEVAANSKFVRQRRHTRVRLHKPVSAVSTNLKEGCRLEIKTASLSGGIATISRHLPPGTQVQLKLQLGLRNVQATALMRDYRAQDMAFEIVDMTLDERSKYRRLLSDNHAHSTPVSDRNSQGPAPESPIPS
ncbi:MAG: HEAT repeat domain-containing protein [Candidatus Acidiferrales bacterium]